MSRRFSAVLVALAMSSAACSAPAASDRVRLERVPNGGIQPQAVHDAAGVVHVVYFKGDPAGGDIYYVRRADDGRYSNPLRVNSQERSATALGSVRGAQIALGRRNRVHVVWNGSDQAQPRPSTGMPLLYSRLMDSGEGFEPQCDLVTRAGGLDGGGTVAADAEGRVFVAWTSNATTVDDAGRAVYLIRSEDEGRSFASEQRISAQELGACACCSTRALVARDGSVHILYRAATDGVDRDTVLLSSRDIGVTFSTSPLDRWRIEACPLTTGFLTEGPRGVLAAWETRAQIFFAFVDPAAHVSPSRSVPGAGRRKHPVVAYNTGGEALLAWVEDTAWAKGGSVAWQLYDREGRAASEHGTAHGVPAWGLTAIAPLPGGPFLLLY